MRPPPWAQFFAPIVYRLVVFQMTYLRVMIFTHSLKTFYKIPMSTWVQSFAPKVYGLVLIPIDIPKGQNVNL